MMAQHTPGPWQAEALTTHSAPNERPWVGRLAESRYAALSCGDTQAEAVANARLIAAAPDLLEAALALDASWLDTFPKGPDGDYGAVSIADEHAELWRQFRLAIAKATPEALAPHPVCRGEE